MYMCFHFDANDLHRTYSVESQKTHCMLCVLPMCLTACHTDQKNSMGRKLMTKHTRTSEIKEHSSLSELFMQRSYILKKQPVTCSSSVLLCMRWHSACWHFDEKHKSVSPLGSWKKKQSCYTSQAVYCCGCLMDGISRMPWWSCLL